MNHLFVSLVSIVAFASASYVPINLLNEYPPPLITTVTKVRGVVTADYRDAVEQDFDGFYIQAPVQDTFGIEANSRAIFISTDAGVTLPEINEGYFVEVINTDFIFKQSGEPSLLVKTTSTVNVLCDTPSIEITPGLLFCEDVEIITQQLPDLAPYAENFGYRNMLHSIPYDMTVSNSFRMSSDGIGLTKGGLPIQGTHQTLPGDAANLATLLGQRNTITIKSAGGTQFPLGQYLDSEDVNELNIIQAGTVVPKNALYATVIKAKSFSFFFKPTKFGNARIGEAFDAIVPNREIPTILSTPNVVNETAARVKIAGLNVENYFTTFNKRGADDEEEFERQGVKLFKTVLAMDAAVLGLQEMENLPDDKALLDFTSKVNALAALEGIDQKYEAIVQGSVGTDEIKCAIIYQPKYVTPVGDAAVLLFNDEKNRPSVAQTFEASGDRFTVVSNHFKSKGPSGCGKCEDVTAEDAALCGIGPGRLGGCDKGDGQANWANLRLNAAKKLAAWIATNPTNEQDGNMYISVGDYNSYRYEDSMRFLREQAGFVDLNLRDHPEDKAGYTFSGLWGNLDFLLATPEAASVCGSSADDSLFTLDWHSNSIENTMSGYSKRFGTAYVPHVFRSSDHDPAIVMCDFKLMGTMSPTAAPTVLETVACDEALFAQYGETFGNNKWLTIKNPTNGILNLEGCTVGMFNNMKTSPDVTQLAAAKNKYVLPATSLSPGETFVICRKNSEVIDCEACDVVEGSVTSFNGDDFVGLYNANTGSLFDAVGTSYFSSWGVNTILTRQPYIETGNAVFTTRGNGAEWIMDSIDGWLFANGGVPGPNECAPVVDNPYVGDISPTQSPTTVQETATPTVAPYSNSTIPEEEPAPATVSLPIFIGTISGIFVVAAVALYCQSEKNKVLLATEHHLSQFSVHHSEDVKDNV